MKKQTSIFLLLISLLCFSQQISLLNSEKSKISFRGLSVPNDNIVWISGSGGTIGLSTDGGNSFKWINPKGFSDRDFRAITGFDDKTAIAIAIASPAIILKTIDGGLCWKEVYRDEHPDAFIDDISFYDKNPLIGIAVGDPINGESYFIETTDGGETWRRIIDENFIKLEENEAFFAASNSNLKLIDENSFFVVSGGQTSNLIFNGDKNIKINLNKTSSNTSGANGIDFSSEQNYGLIAGGDFMNPKDSTNNLFIFEIDENGIPKVNKPIKSPFGYKSGIAILNNEKAISCGMLSVDFSNDKGQNWKTISKTGFHSCKKSKSGNKVYLVGAEGRIGMLVE